MCRAMISQTTMMSDTLYNKECHGSRLAGFLADYAARLWGCGATCERIDKNVSRIAATYGYQVELSISPGSVSAFIHSAGSTAGFAACRRPPHSGVDYSLNTALSALSWSICDSGMPLDNAVAQFSRHC